MFGLSSGWVGGGLWEGWKFFKENPRVEEDVGLSLGIEWSPVVVEHTHLMICLAVSVCSRRTHPAP